MFLENFYILDSFIVLVNIITAQFKYSQVYVIHIAFYLNMYLKNVGELF